MPSPCPHPPLSFGDLLLPESPSFKVVGLTFQGNLSWAKHVANVYKKGRQALGIIRRARHVLSKRTVAFLYKSHVRSTMEYCSPIWMGNTATELGRLDSVQRSATRHGHISRTAEALQPCAASTASSMATLLPLYCTSARSECPYSLAPPERAHSTVRVLCAPESPKFPCFSHQHTGCVVLSLCSPGPGTS